MIQLKRCNYITGEPNELAFAVSDIIRFLETDGKTPLLLTPPKSHDNGGSSTSLKYLYHTQLNFTTLDEFTEILNNKANLFRVDLLIFDFYHLKPFQITSYKKIIDNLGIDHIIIAKEYHYKTTDDVNDFHIRREYKDLHKNEVHITDNINKWTSTLKSLSVSYIRDKKIDNLFGDND